MISFSTSYLGLGAAAVIDIDRSGLGRQADTLAAQIMGGSRLADISPALPIDTVIKTNQQVLKHLRRFQ
ncbi:MAG: hypothetical protein JJE30_05930 [Desulfuromonadales bacterium]|nr:hypothetical protein [Desulfuromonadales bacterium]